MLEKVNGYKTYVICGLMFAFATIGLLIGKLDAGQAVTLILEAAAIAGLRNGVTKSGMTILED